MESAIMIAIGTVLSVFKFIDMPYGGSVTIGCMLPVIIIAYRHGFRWGLLTGFVFGLLQQLLGLENLSYVTSRLSMVAVFVLDYIAAYMSLGFAGLFQKTKPQQLALTYGALISCVLRYLCHVISGATVWAGLAIPTKVALIYSVGYNATYMIPELIVTAILAYYIGSVLNFKSENIVPLRKETQKKAPALNWIGGAILAGALLFDVRMIFSNLQNAESGEFDLAGFANVNWPLLLIVSSVCIIIAIILLLFSRKLEKSNAE